MENIKNIIGKDSLSSKRKLKFTINETVGDSKIIANDLLSVSEFLFTILYADDTCVLMNGKHLEDLITRMQK